MNFSQFCQHLQKLEDTSSRLEMTAQLASLFNELEPDEVAVACYLMQGRLVPIYKSLEFQMSDKLLMRAFAKVLLKLTPDESLPTSNLFDQQDDSFYLKKIEQAYKKIGDLGLTIETLLKDDKQQSNQSILDVYQELKVIAKDGGDGSQDRKVEQTASLLSKLNSTSAKFVSRIILGKIRLGFSTMTMIDALSWLAYGDKTNSAKIEEAYQKKADIGKLAQGYLAVNSKNDRDIFLKSYLLESGVPVLPALCQRLNSANEIIEKMGEVIIEPKYDGLRAQIHINKLDKQSPIKIFTRSLEDVTHMFPETSELLKQVNATNCIFDAEAIGYDPTTGVLLPFQQTITRKRKHDVQEQSDSTPIRFYLFDLLFLDGVSLIDDILIERKKKLAEIVSLNQSVQITDFIITSSANQVHQYHIQQLEDGLEGAVIKRVNSRYRAGRKGWRWVKIKEQEGERGKLSDSLDCIVMGYYSGKGKRTKFGVGAFLAGVLADSGEIKTVAKIGTGLSDDQFLDLKKRADAVQTQEKPSIYDVPKELKPDVWLQPEIVVEIAADELTNSPLHTAKKALRFPRLVKFRDDKKLEQITKVEELEEIKVV